MAKKYRRQGVATAALRAAIASIRDHGGGVIEAYPLDPATSDGWGPGTRVDYGHVGTVSMFSRLGPYPLAALDRLVHGHAAACRRTGISHRLWPLNCAAVARGVAVVSAHRSRRFRGNSLNSRSRVWAGRDEANLPAMLRCATVDVSVRELRNYTARVIAAVESGEPVVLTVHGRPVADIVPRRTRSERRPTEQVLADLAEIRALAKQLGVHSPAEDFDTGLTTDDMMR